MSESVRNAAQQQQNTVRQSQFPVCPALTAVFFKTHTHTVTLCKMQVC